MHSSANAELEADIEFARSGRSQGTVGRADHLGSRYISFQGFALTGGLLFLALVGMSLVSIVGRKLFAMPVPGDIEMLQMGTAVASATLLPYCEMNRSHLRVDFFTINIRPQAGHAWTRSPTLFWAYLPLSSRGAPWRQRSRSTNPPKLR